MLPRQTIEKLNSLSKEIYGATSRWRKMMDKGILQDKLDEAGKKIEGIQTVVHLTAEEVEEKMKGFIKERDTLKKKIMDAIAKQKEGKKEA